MSSCRAPAGSPCRTVNGVVAAQYHSARFRRVPRLAGRLTVRVPAIRRPGAAWTELPRPAASGPGPAGHVRIGYARTSTTRQSLDIQTAALRAVGITVIFAEQVSSRLAKRPELDRAIEAARAARRNGKTVSIVAHNHKRAGRGLELANLAERLRGDDIGLEFLTGPLRGAHDPTGIVLTVLAAVSASDREYIRERTLEGHEEARARGKVIGRVPEVDETMRGQAREYREEGLSYRQIASRLTYETGPKAGKRPAASTVKRMLDADADAGAGHEDPADAAEDRIVARVG